MKKVDSTADTLKRYIKFDAAQKNVESRSETVNETAISTKYNEHAMLLMLDSLKSAIVERNAAYKHFMHARAEKRRAALQLYDFGTRCGRLALRLGETYSGVTVTFIRWGEASAAETSVDWGDNYSGRAKKYRTRNAQHVITLSPEDVCRLYKHATLAELSAEEGLPVIGLMADGRYVWVRSKSKRVTHVRGYIAYNTEEKLCFHSTKSQAAADAGLVRKLTIRKVGYEKAAESKKAARRLRLVLRLCGNNIHATVEDALKQGYCMPGIKAFQERHGIGYSATLAQLVQTGNSDAVRLAYTVVRNVASERRRRRA